MSRPRIGGTLYITCPHCNKQTESTFEAERGVFFSYAAICHRCKFPFQISSMADARTIDRFDREVSSRRFPYGKNKLEKRTGRATKEPGSNLG